jgi:hypothetical protein
LVFALIELAWPRFSQSLDPLGRLEQFIGGARLELASLSAFMPQLAWPLAIAVSAWLVLTPLALYLILSER